MNKQIREEMIGEIVQTVTDQMRESIADLMQEIMEDKMLMLQDTVTEAVREALADMEFHMKDGTVVKPRPMMKLQTVEKDKVLVCYGGLRVDRCTYKRAKDPEGYALWVQTNACSWDIAGFYLEKNDAMNALERVKTAMERGDSLIEL